jgi:diketogulonate reductase-like aldo/keto reductase
LTAHGAEIPAIGFGTSSLGDCGEVVATALKLGYRHIDTAWKYGTERGVGEGIRASGVGRDEIFLTTKVSHEYLRTDDFARSVDESLENLGVDFVDLLLVHLAQPGDCAQRADRRARQGKARGPCAPHRRRELQYRACSMKRSGFARSRW